MKLEMKPILTALMAILCFMTLPARIQASPRIGDRAPAVKVAKWFTRKPPALPGDDGSMGRVFLVEFWATWAPGCRKSIPHLAGLHEKFEQDGLIIVSLSNEEPEVIEKFLEKMKMPYYVAYDDNMQTNDAWVNDVAHIPYAFMVDRKGLVAWAGNPAADSDEMDRVLAKVLAGKYDVEKARNTAAAQLRYQELMKELQPAYAARQEKEVFQILDKMIALQGDELRPYLIKRQLLREFERTDEIDAFDLKIEAIFKDSATDLNDILLVELEAPYSRRNPALMLRCAARLGELTRGRDVRTLVTLAEIYGNLGLIDEAIDAQAQALALASEEQPGEIEKVLAYYKAIRKLTAEKRARAPEKAKPNKPVKGG